MAWESIQYEYSTTRTFHKMLLWISANANIYFSMKEKSSDQWIFLAGEADHTLATGEKLVEYSTESQAQTNYFTTSRDSQGKVVAILPTNIQAKYVRLHIQTGANVTIWEWIPSTYFTAHEIISGELEITDKLSDAPIIKVVASDIDRVKVGKVDSSTYGVVGYNNLSATIFELTDKNQQIGGWNFDASKLYSSNIKLDSETPSIQLGNATGFMTGVGVFMGNDTGTYKVHIGNPNGNYLKWDGTDLTITGAYIGAGSDIASTIANSFTINDDADDVTVQLILDRTTGGPATFGWNGTVVSLDKPLDITGNITLTGTVDGVDIAALKTDVDGFPDELKNLVTAEIQQLENIGTTTISAAQWGYLGAIDQGVASTDSPTFNDLTITAPSSIYSLSHDSFTGFVANEHIDHSGVTISAGTGLAGGGDITTSRTLSLSHLGLESLTDPNADRIMFWDDSAGTLAWLSLGNSLSLTTTTLDTVQDIRTTDSPTFATVKLTNLTDGYIPYHVSDASGLANSPIYTDGTKVGIGTTSLGAALHILNSIAPQLLVKSDTGNARLDIRKNAVGDIAQLILGDGTDTDRWSLRSTDAEKFAIFHGTNADLVTVEENGNVGIGTTDPGAKLDILPSSSSDVVLRTKSLQSTAPLGSELVSNGDFSTIPDTSWTWGTGWSHDTTNLEADHTAGNTDALTQNISVTNGQTYQVEITIKNRTTGYVTLDINGVYIYKHGSATTLNTNATYKRTLVANTTGSATLSITPSSDFDGSVDNITVKQITGVSQPNFALLDDTGSVLAEIRGKNSLYNLALGVNALRYNTTGNYNSAVGMSALFSNTTGYYNSAVGVNALYYNTTGYYNSAVGVNALFSNTTGYYNSAVGVNALYYNTTGYYNSAVGVYALLSNTTGYFNSAVGVNALRYNTTGYFNSAVGVYALRYNTTGYYNSAVGMSALLSNTTGYFNSAVGMNALRYNTTGYLNSAVGANAGKSITGGGANETSNTSLYLGAETKAYADGDSNEIVIGYNTTGFGSNTAAYGNSSITKHIFQAGNLGLNTTTPRKLADFLSITQAQLRLSYTDNSVYADFQVDSSGDLTITPTGNLVSITSTVSLSNLTDGYIPYHVSDASGLADSPIYTDGTNVGIGTTSLGAKLQVDESTGSNVALHVRKTDTVLDGSKKIAVFSANESGTYRDVVIIKEANPADDVTNIPLSVGQAGGKSIATTGKVLIGTSTSTDGMLQVLDTTEQLRLLYDTSNYTSFTVNSSGTLTVAPTGDFIFNPTGNDIYPNTNYDLNLGLINKKFLTLHAAELWVETLVAQNTMATIGGRILVAPTTELTSDLAAADTTIYVKHNNLASGDIVYLESNGKVEFISIDSGPSGTGPYSYTVTRDLDGTGANDWYAGDAVLNTGTTGDGFIDIYSVRGVKTATEYGPTIVGNIRNSATYNDWTEAWAIGNLNGLYGYGSDTYGAAFGKYSSSDYLTIDPSNGIRFFDSGNVVRAQLSSGVWTLGYTTSEHVRISSTEVQIKNGATVYTDLTDGVLTLGDSANENVLINTSGVQLRDGTTVYGQFAATTTLGLTTSEHIEINSTSIQIRDGTSVYTELTGGVLTLGLTSGGEYLQIDSTGIEGYSNAVKLFELTSSGLAYIGDQSNEHIKLSSTGVELKDGTTVYGQFAATTTLGQVAGGEYVSIASTGIDMYGGGVKHAALSSAGTFWAGDTSSTERIEWNSTDGLFIADSANNKVFQADPSGNVNIAGTVEIGVGAFAQLPSDEDLVGYWSFDDGSGTVAVDGSGNGLDGTIYGASWVDGVSGKALSFDGTDDWVDCGNDTSLDITDVITISAWVQFNSFGSAGRAILGKHEAYGFHTYGTSLFGDIWVAGVRKNPSMSGGQTGVWYHFVVTYDGSSVKFFVNGELKDTQNASGAIDTTTNVFNIADVLVYSENFDGLVDEVRIYNRALTESEIKALYLYPAGNRGTTISGNRIQTGIIQSDNLAANAGSLFNLNDGTIKLGGDTTPTFEFDGTDLYIGKVATENVKISSTAVQIRDGSSVYTELAGGVLTLGLTSGDEYLQIDSTGIEGYSNAVKLLELTSAGVAYLGDQSNEHIKLSTSGLQVYDGATLLATYGASTTFYDTGGKDRLVLGTSGITVGDSTDGEYLTVDATNGIRMYGGATLYAQLSNAGVLTLGDSANEHTIIDTGGVTIKDGTTQLANFGSTVTVGQVGDSLSNVYITSGALQLRNNTTAKITLAADGTISLAGYMTIGSGGHIKMGQTAYDTGTGFYLGDVSGTPKFSIGDSANDKLIWDGSSLTVRGSLSAGASSFVVGGLSIQSTGYIRSNTTGSYPYLEFSNSGLQLKNSDSGGTYGTAKYGQDKYGYGALVWLMNSDLGIPWAELKEPQDDSGNDLPSIRLFNREADPTGGSYQYGDLCVVNGVLKIYDQVSGWVKVSSQ